MTSPPRRPPYPDPDALVNHWWWRPGWHVGTRFYTWHVTVADVTALADHVEAYQDSLRRFSFLDLIPREWLHITLQGIDHAELVTNEHRTAVVEGVQRRLASIPPIRLTFDRPVIFTEAVAIPPTDVVPLRSLRDAIRAAVEAGYGSVEGRSTPQFDPHVSLAYVNASVDPRPVRAALDAVRLAPVEVTIDRVSLLELHRDHRMYQWRSVAIAPLGGS
jgi:2'-5' RNA ligase